MFHKNGPTLLELAQQALSGTTAGYDLLAPKFEYTPFRTPDELVAPLVDAVGRQPVSTALDAACGNGALARSLRPVVDERVLGIDISDGMLVEARRLAAESPIEGPEVTFANQDIFAMPYEDEFDVVCTTGAFGHILHHQQDAFILQVKKALRVGGRFIFVTSEMPTMAHTSWWMARGFNAVMHVRNAVVKPPFIMFYLTFTVDRAAEVLWRHGFELTVETPFEAPYQNARLVIATKKAT